MNRLECLCLIFFLSERRNTCVLQRGAEVLHPFGNDFSPLGDRCFTFSMKSCKCFRNN